MKHILKLVSLFAVAGFMLASCEGPMGPAGADGKDGVDGKDGKDANATCTVCHSATNVDLISVEYEFSKHSYGEAAFEEGGNTGCTPCHAQEAFKYVVKNNISATFTVSNGVYSNPYATVASSALGEFGCSTCHSKLHTTYAGTEFFPLTTTAAVPMTMWAGTKTINLTQKGGQSNLCVKCHQPRPFTRSNTTDKNILDYAGLASNPTAVFYDAAQANTLNVLKPSYRTHTHYGTVAAIFAGVGGVEFGTGYSNSAHSTAASCQDCHMAEVNGRAGGHTFNVKGNFKGCNVTGCHSAAPISATSNNKYWLTTRAATKAKLDALAAKLTINGVDILNRNKDAESNLWAGLTTNNYDGYLNIYDPITNPNVELYNASSFQFIGTPPATWSAAQIAYNATLPKITLTNAQMAAIINFQLCLREYSLGIHNTNYSTVLLDNTIAAL